MYFSCKLFSQQNVGYIQTLLHTHPYVYTHHSSSSRKTKLTHWSLWIQLYGWDSSMEKLKSSFAVAIKSLFLRTILHTSIHTQTYANELYLKFSESLVFTCPHSSAARLSFCKLSLAFFAPENHRFESRASWLACCFLWSI